MYLIKYICKNYLYNPLVKNFRRIWPRRKQTRYLASCYKVWESDGIWPNGSVWRRGKVLVLVHWKSNSRIRWRVPLDCFMSSAFFGFSIWFTWVSGGVWRWFLWYMFVKEWVMKTPRKKIHLQIFPIDLDVMYRIVASTNMCYYSENQLFVQRSQYIRTENPLHKQSEKAKTCH